jgi:hypothetical protein
MPAHSQPPPPPIRAGAIDEVRYSLPELLREVKLERTAPAFTMEKLDPVETAKLFAKPKPRRGLKTRK